MWGRGEGWRGFKQPLKKLFPSLEHLSILISKSTLAQPEIFFFSSKPWIPLLLGDSMLWNCLPTCSDKLISITPVGQNHLFDNDTLNSLITWVFHAAVWCDGNIMLIKMSCALSDLYASRSSKSTLHIDIQFKIALWKSIAFSYFFLMCMCLLRTWVCGSRDQKTGLDLLITMAVVSHLMWGLGTESGSSATVVYWFIFCFGMKYPKSFPLPSFCCWFWSVFYCNRKETTKNSTCKQWAISPAPW